MAPATARAAMTVAVLVLWAGAVVAQPYLIVDTGQTTYYDDAREIAKPAAGGRFHGQDADYEGPQPAYLDMGEGTVLDLYTGLCWQSEVGEKVSSADARAEAAACRLGGHDDWRLPTVKELYSLIDFRGNAFHRLPYLDTRHFAFRYGDERAGERLIDAQYWSSTEYVGRTMGGNATVFGVNFADGRIKGYPKDLRRDGRQVKHFVRYVRGNPRYGINDFADNRDGTVTDRATGLMWMKADSGKPLNWEQALAYAESLEHAGHTDWRLPNAKELQSLVDYSRAPDAADPNRRGPALDPVFEITDPEAWFWTGTTGPPDAGWAVYLAFGLATGYMRGPGGGPAVLMNVHGAGAQRSDPKAGDPNDPRWVGGHGPQGDVVRVFNYARAVRNAQ